MLAVVDFEFCSRCPSAASQRLHSYSPNPSEHPSSDSLVERPGVSFVRSLGTCTPAVMHASANVAGDPPIRWPFVGDIGSLLCKM
jgi:hypothetical protein